MSYKIYKNNTWIECAGQPDLTDYIQKLGNEIVSEQPYHFPYHFTLGATAGTGKSTLTGNLYTITLDNNKTLTQYPLSVDIPAPTNMVTTDAAQTITSTKTFDNGSSTNAVSGSSVSISDTTHTTEYANGTIGYDTYRLTLPAKTGTVALISDIPTPATNLVTTDTDQIITGHKIFSASGTTASVKLMSDNQVTGRLSITGTNNLRNSVATFAFEPEINEGTYLIDLPEKNGTLLTNEGSGDVSLMGAYKFDFIGDQIKRADTTQALNITGGTSSSDGASLSLCGGTMSSNEGNFSLTANNGTTSKSLVGQPDGTLTWDNNNVITAAGGVMTTDQALVKNNDTGALAIQGGSADSKGARLSLSGKDRTGGYAGMFTLRAYDGTNDKILTGKPDGTLTWGSNDISGTPTSYTISTGSGTNISVYRKQCYKVGRMVFVSIAGKNNTEIAEYTSSTAIFTGLPAPVAQTDIGVFYFDRSSSRGTRFRLNTSGQIVTDSEGFEANYFTFNFSYISAS